MIRRQVPLLGKPVRGTQAQFPRKAWKSSKYLKQVHEYGSTKSAHPTPSALSLRCSAERSMPTNSAVREILPEKRLIWAIR
jgi:hypothetical protein